MEKGRAIRTNPVSLNETTLETNIASEIVALFNSPFNFGYPFRLRWLFEFNRINFNAFKKRKVKLYRLTPTEENQGGGWDTKIQIPKGSNDSRAIFIQFKRGVHSNGNSISGSIFNVAQKNPNPNAEFSFNDNSNNNQHQTLKDLKDQLLKSGLPEKSVMYGFPRITKLDVFENLEEDLLLHTTFLTIKEIDEEAKKVNVNLYDGKTHQFRTCYIKEDRREISSDVFQLSNSDDRENVIYEIILIKLSHFRNQFPKNISPKYINDELFLILAEYLKVNPSDSVSLEGYYPQPVQEEIRNYFKRLIDERENIFYRSYDRINLDGNPFEWRERLFKRVVKFFNEISGNQINIQSDIPSNYTFNLNSQESYEFDLNTEFNISLLVF